MPEVQADFAELLEAATAVGEAHMEAEKAKKPRLKTKQTKTLFRSLAPLNFRFLLMLWLLCKLFLIAKLRLWHMLLHPLPVSRIPCEVT